MICLSLNWASHSLRPLSCLTTYLPRWLHSSIMHHAFFPINIWVTDQGYDDWMMSKSIVFPSSWVDWKLGDILPCCFGLRERKSIANGVSLETPAPNKVDFNIAGECRQHPASLSLSWTSEHGTWSCGESPSHDLPLSEATSLYFFPELLCVALANMASLMASWAQGRFFLLSCLWLMVVWITCN